MGLSPRGEDITPLVGALSRDRLAEALGALEIALTSDEITRIEAAVPPNAGAYATTLTAWPHSTA